MKTDEEMAEEYIKVNNLEWELECNRTSPIGEVKQAFLAGLKAGKDMAEADLATIAYMQGAEAKGKRIEELEARIAELDCQKNRNKSCYSCANATEMCFRNEIGCPCGKYKSYKDENAELKDDNKVMADNYSKMEQKFYNNLTKAKELIQELVHEIAVLYIATDRTVISPTIKQAEQFLKEVEK